MSHSKVLLAALLGLAVSSVLQLPASAETPFREWIKDHPDWMNSHRDRYNFFMQHPEQAERNRGEWCHDNGRHKGWEKNGKMSFSDWCRGHQDWVHAHNDRYQFFMHHRDQAENCRAEWEGWNGHMNSGHPEWEGWNGKMNSGHPEWEGWNGPGGHGTFAQWCKGHPEWVSAHRDRYDHFMKHPDEAEKCRDEWMKWKPSSNGLHLGETAHAGHIPGMDPHSAGLRLGEANKLMHGNEGLHLGEAHKLTPHSNEGLHLGELAKLAPHNVTPAAGPAAAHGGGAHFAEMMKEVQYEHAIRNPAEHPAAARLMEMAHGRHR